MDLSIENAINALKGLLQIPSVESEAVPGKPFGKGAADALDYSLNLMDKLGFKTKNGDYYYGYGEIGDGELFGILAHLDVVPEGDGWLHAPYGGEIVENRLYGRGAEDDKGPFVAALFSAARLLAEGYMPKKRIRFIVGCDEESGWECMKHYTEHEEMPSQGFSPDADFPVIYAEKGVLNIKIKFPLPNGVSISGGTRVNIVPNKAEAIIDNDKLVASLARASGLNTTVVSDKLHICSTGKSAHGSTPDKGINAIVPLFGALGIKYPVFNRLYAAFNSTSGEGINLNVSDTESGAATFNVGVCSVHGGDLDVLVDIRYPVTFTEEFMLAGLKKEFPDAEISVTGSHKPLYVSQDSELVTKLLTAYNKVTGENAKPIAIGGATYARVLPSGVAFGPVFPKNESTIHQPNENISIDNFRTMSEIYYEAIKSLCF